jgi:hypothetical protein
MKNYHDFHDQVYVQDNPQGEAHGWIQWKGTSVCMDMHCKCGYHGHIDADFFYYYECPKCHKKYAVGQNVKLIELSDEQTKYVTENRSNMLKTCEYEEEE